MSRGEQNLQVMGRETDHSSDANTNTVRH